MPLENITYSPGEPIQNFYDKINAAIDAINAFDTLGPVPVGSITPYFGVTAPSSSYLVCAGQAISRTTYSELFALLSTNYGAGDGSTTFNLPDLKGKFLVGYNSGDSDYNALTSAKSGGSKTHTLTVDEIPAHTHSSLVSAGNIAAGGASVAPVGSGNTGSTGGGLPHENRPPYLTVNYLIRVL